MLNEDLLSRQRGDHVAFQGFAPPNALVLTKVMLAHEQIDLARRFSTWPRIRVILFELLFCTMLFLAFVSLLPFFTFKSVARAIGNDRIEAILFKHPDTWHHPQ